MFKQLALDVEAEFMIGKAERIAAVFVHPLFQRHERHRRDMPQIALARLRLLAQPSIMVKDWLDILDALDCPDTIRTRPMQDRRNGHVNQVTCRLPPDET